MPRRSAGGFLTGAAESGAAESGRHIVHVVVRGRVQGVSFRAWAMREAERRAVDGWVRNRADGAVEAILAGTPDSVQDLVEACRAGPAAAIVTDVITLPHTDDPGAGFRIRA